VVHHYGARPEFVVLGGLVPELLCAGGPWQHAGTTDVDVQVNLEIACGAVNVSRLERALQNAGFEPDGERVWRWALEGAEPQTIVKFELLADMKNEPAGHVVHFEGCAHLGAVNLRGTGFAARDIEIRGLASRIAGVAYQVEVNVTGLAGFLLTKAAAAHARQKPKDWYDIAFVLLHNDAGGPEAAAAAVRVHFPNDITGPTLTALNELRTNFHDPAAQGPQAYAEQMLLDHPELDAATLRADAVLAVEHFYTAVCRT
jgi:hypothetical protein